MDQQVLFEIGKPEKPENRCRNCKFITTHEYNKTWKYCTRQPVRGDRRNFKGIKKIKANNAACFMFEKNEPKAEKI